VEDVRALTQPLWQLAEGADSAQGELRPPVVRFVWGKAWNVPAVVAAVAERLEAFGPSGAPRRSWMRMRLLRIPDPAPRPRRLEAAAAPPEEQVHELVGGGAAASRAAEDGAPPPTGIAGERLDELAQRFYGDPSAWRLIAEANDVEDPLHLPSGAAVRIPPRGTP
jgi:hypothetical protein